MTDDGSHRRQGFNKWTFVLCCALVLLCLCVFYQVYTYAFLSCFGDDVHITDNPNVRKGLRWEGVRWALTTTHQGYWHPLTWLSHMLDVKLFEYHAGGYHLTNLLLHIVNTVMLFLILLRLTGRTWPCVITAALFAVHPLHVEPVVWLSCRKELLSTFMLLLSLAAYHRYVQDRGAVDYLLMFVFYCLALSSKPEAACFPFLLLLVDYWPLRRFGGGSMDSRLGGNDAEDARGETADGGNGGTARVLWEKVPLLLMSAFAMTFHVIAAGQDRLSHLIDRLPLTARIGHAVVAYAEYLLKAVWPGGLAAAYPSPAGPPSPGTFLACGLLLSAITAVALWRLRKTPYIFVGWFWFLIALAPNIGILPFQDAFMADRYSYVPLIGIFAAVTWSLADVPGNLPMRKEILGTAAAGALFVCVTCSWVQTSYWGSGVRLFRHAVSVTTNNARAHYYLGRAYASSQPRMLEESEKEFKLAHKLDPGYDAPKYGLAEVYAHTNNLDEATVFFSNALDDRPDDAALLNNLGQVLLQQNRPAEAARFLAQVIEQEPNHLGALISLGRALALDGKTEQAMAILRQALALDPDNTLALFYLGQTFAAVGEYDQARAVMMKAWEIDPAFTQAVEYIDRIKAIQRLNESKQKQPQ